MNAAKAAEIAFNAYAWSRGYNHKVVGDYSFSKTKSPQSSRIRLISARNGKIQVSENGVITEVEVGKP